MGLRGRATKVRTSELGIYIEQLRRERGWSVHDLAREAVVPYKTLSKLELNRNLPRHPEIFLWKLANALGVHPDKLLIRASLTPMLRQPTNEITSSPTKMTSLTLLVTKEEGLELEKYLQYLRFLNSVDSVCQKAEKEIGSTKT
jgi:transcriptional regulator with XRE-family HTH domain